MLDDDGGERERGRDRKRDTESEGGERGRKKERIVRSEKRVILGNSTSAIFYSYFFFAKCYDWMTNRKPYFI